ncbi:unnamed protein product [Merluccius merluccius]
MFAARVSGGAVARPSLHRKQSLSSRRNSQDGKRSSASKQPLSRSNKAAMIREMETNWYLKMFGLGKEEMVSTKTGMPYSYSYRMTYLPTCSVAQSRVAALGGPRGPAASGKGGPLKTSELNSHFCGPQATCSDIPNPKQKAPIRPVDRGQGGAQAQGQGRLCRGAPAGGGTRPCNPLMLWTKVKANGLVELKQLEEFLNSHALSLQETVKSQTGMVYR